MRAYSLLELQKMNKTERMALYKELAAMGMFYAVEKGNTKGKQSVCRGCNLFMPKGGNLRFRHLVCNSKCYAPKVTTDTCGRWHPECLIAMQELNPERFVFTNPEFKPIKTARQLAGFDDLTHEDQDLILRVLDGKTGVVTKRRLTSSGLSRKLSFTGSPSSGNPAADPVVPALEKSRNSGIASQDRILPKIILRSPSKLNSEVKKEQLLNSPLKAKGIAVEKGVLNAPTTGVVFDVNPSANNGNGISHKVSSHPKSPVKVSNPAVVTKGSPAKSFLPNPVSEKLDVNPVSPNPISPGQNLAVNLIAFKSPKKVPVEGKTHVQSSPKSPAKNCLQSPTSKSPKKVAKTPQTGFEILSDGIDTDEMPPSKRAFEPPSDDLAEKKLKL